jgi:hypothetical protein
MVGLCSGIQIPPTTTSDYIRTDCFRDAAKQCCKGCIKFNSWGAAALFQVSNLNFSGFNSFYTVKIEMSGPILLSTSMMSSLGSFSDNTHSTGKSRYTVIIQRGTGIFSMALLHGRIWYLIIHGIQIPVRAYWPENGTWGTDNYWTRTSGDGTFWESWPGAVLQLHLPVPI